MPTQIPDRFSFNHHTYSVVGLKGEGIFEPRDLGLQPLGLFTACWRGYICEYSLNADQLVLEGLHISLGSFEGDQFVSYHPEINGIKPEALEKPEPFNNIYQKLDIEVNFTGGILIGDDFIRELYAPRSLHPAWKYKTILELIFEEGIVLDVADVSDKVAVLRKRLLERPLKPGLYASEVELQAWIRATFKLHYDL